MVSKESLAHEIDALREQLHHMILSRDNFHSKKMVSLSYELDEKIVEFMILNTHEEQ